MNTSVSPILRIGTWVSALSTLILCVVPALSAWLVYNQLLALLSRADFALDTSAGMLQMFGVDEADFGGASENVAEVIRNTIQDFISTLPTWVYVVVAVLYLLYVCVVFFTDFFVWRGVLKGKLSALVIRTVISSLVVIAGVLMFSSLSFLLSVPSLGVELGTWSILIVTICHVVILGLIWWRKKDRPEVAEPVTQW